MYKRGYASVAQLVEQRFRKARVGGSNPLAGSGTAQAEQFRPTQASTDRNENNGAILNIGFIA
jgi:hypothetical protein